MTLPSDRQPAPPAPIFLGFCAKRHTPWPQAYADLPTTAHIVEVASAAECLAARPPDWIGRWDFNRASCWNDAAAAWACVPTDAQASYRLYAYRAIPLVFDTSATPYPLRADEVFARHWARQRTVLLQPHTLLTALSCSEPHADMDQTTDTSDRCAECGGPTQAGWTCWEQLGLLLALEFDDPDLRSEHFLTVACYNLQHPAQFTDTALAGLRASFVARLDHDLSVADIRRRTAAATAGATRVLRDAAERRPVLKRWSMTIADVYLPERPIGGAGRVRAWAASIRREM